MDKMLRAINNDSSDLAKADKLLGEVFELLANTNNVPVEQLIEAASHYIAGAKSIMKTGLNDIDDVGRISSVLAALDGYTNDDSLRKVVQNYMSKRDKDVEGHLLKLVAKPRNADEQQTHNLLSKIGNSNQFVDFKDKWDRALSNASFSKDQSSKDEAKRKGLTQLQILDSAVRSHMSRIDSAKQERRKFDWHSQSPAK